ncbi:hypothetical protein [Usitatibacter palustris]|uniref:Lipoprotein n=1 Tax=Usitatibacter palustris TaxID=2732487 RepID=A0A6M4HA36_9PROT|nr:hypothetical protein [Usitatibacter palustris]QJR15573.1 hypothetical protein DSM104440_02395 [Usitatibacter palustris]
MRFALGVAAAALLLSACTEVGQDDPKAKVYAGKVDEKAYAGDAFKGDQKKWEQALAARANFQNERARATWQSVRPQ